MKTFSAVHCMYNSEVSDFAFNDFSNFIVGNCIFFTFVINGKEIDCFVYCFKKGNNSCAAFFPFAFGSYAKTDFINTVSDMDTKFRIFFQLFMSSLYSFFNETYFLERRFISRSKCGTVFTECNILL